MSNDYFRVCYPNKWSESVTWVTQVNTFLGRFTQFTTNGETKIVKVKAWNL